MATSHTIGIVGGSGQLGGAIARALLRTGTVAPDRLWISNRSGSAAGFDTWPGIHVTADNQALADACDVVLLSVPPNNAAAVEMDAADRLVISVMAGVTIARIAERTRSSRVVRAMSNPAADMGLAYSPWCAGDGVTDGDRDMVRRLFGACGLTDEVPDEEQIDRFTALTGPVPGFVAYYADCMVAYAVKHGIDPAVAERAIRQLFHASGIALAQSDTPMGKHVREMIAYAGTTAAGLDAMQSSPLAASIEVGLDAAFRKAQTIG
jgi:pyrroline-5-carboxylate reductase